MTGIKRTLTYLKKYLLPTGGALFSLLLVNAANLISPKLLQRLIDDGVSALNMDVVWSVVIALLGVAAVRGIFNFLQGYLGEIASQGVAYELRNSIFEKLQNLSFSYHDRSHTGKLMTRMTSDVELVRMFLGRGLVNLVSAIVLMIGTLVMLFSMNWQLTLMVMIIIPGVGGVFMMFVKKIMPMSKIVQQKLGTLNMILQENLAGSRIVKAFAREGYEIERYSTANVDLLDANVSMIKLFTTFFPLVFFMGNLGMVIVIGMGGLFVINGTLTLGELVAFTGYLIYMLMPMFMMGMIGAMMSRAEASAQRLFDVLDAESEVKDAPDAVSLPKVEGRVELRDVRFRYIGAETDVVSDFSFVANPGQTVAILGQTGAGKSSIITLIPRFYDVAEGAVLIDGHDVRDVTLDSLRKQIGIVLQETTLFSGTIRDNIAYGRPEATLEEVTAVAKAAQAHDFILEQPNGYDTEVGERGVGLSGGQKQRIAIARALLLDPRILIMDDSTSSVDAETEYKIQQALEELQKGRTTFVIAQRISTVRSADKILVLDNGKLAAEGTHEELQRTSELYMEIIETQFGKDN
ncbi:MAG: ABC transporter ATP-binding protein [Anaerolineae bacterium]|jgi:ATP-binding cassette subfamily B protein|nr:ABC transporter ATP-binding protein [Anaerolineae bacterium]MBT3712165.1 ABC transporter ATP-binding protein [Anaerolineae bacterium]MBT4310232.1 ABC transporter ATP-binding protein [Anaerolineae bacterium]MBT4460011.1 ABC transporter ATP-binding protein [Anaerolineae bacterium]MBT4842188.1 ABC transporter ATP-binding protein [Anaerolineae bacterium]